MDVGVIGVGDMGQNHARVYSEMRGVGDLVIFDLDTEAAKRVAKKNDALVAESMDELLSQVEAVNCCVPTPFHYKVAEEIIGKGVNLLIEKPICLNSTDGARLAEMVPDGLTVGVGHIERFNPIVSEITKIVKDPLYVEFKRHNPASGRVSGSSVVEDLMIHDIDIVTNSLFSDGYSLTSIGNQEVCSALFDFSGTPVYLSASRKSSKKIRSVHIEEEDFTVVGDFMSQELYIYRKPGQYKVEDERYVQENIIEKVMVGKLEPLKTELATFLKCAGTGKEFPITPKQAVNNLKICEEIIGGCSG